MAIRKLLLPLTGTAAGEAALTTCPDDRPHLERARHSRCTSGSTAATSRRWPARACRAR